MRYVSFFSSVFCPGVLMFVCFLLLPVSVWSAEVSLTWEAPGDGRVAGYNVYYGETGTSFKTTPKVSLDGENNTRADLSDIKEGVEYSFAVTSTDGNNESEFSEIIKYTYNDSDGDGVVDENDGCPEDPAKTEEGACGCGISDTDTDGDGVPDCNDEDSDNDGMPDEWEISYGLDPLFDDSGEDSDGDGISNLTEYKAGTDPFQMTYNISPEQPVLVSPDTGTQVVDDLIVFETGSFVDSDDDGHRATHWQISTDHDFAELVFEKTCEDNLTRLSVSELIFSGNTTYYWRAKYIDSRLAESAWSPAGSFTTGVVGNDDNQNGISDDCETTEQTDLDVNGIPDSDQDDMKVVGVNPSVQLGLQCASADGEITYLEHIDPIFVTDEGKPYDLPFGLINFKIRVHEPGRKIIIPVHFSESIPENAGWYKYDSIDGWQDYSDNVTFGPDRKTIFIELEDGGIGDADGVANGIIIDPSGLAITSSDSDDGTGDEPDDGSSGDSTSGSSGGGGGCFIDSLF